MAWSATSRRTSRATIGAPVAETQYKVVETSSVTDLELERIINETVSQGWALDGIQFAMREASKRPSMAFLLFTSSDRDAPER